MVDSTFAERLKSAREKREMTQPELATAARVSQALVSKIERGLAQGSTKVRAFAGALRVDAEWLELGTIDGVSADLQTALAPPKNRRGPTTMPRPTDEVVVAQEPTAPFPWPSDEDPPEKLVRLTTTLADWMQAVTPDARDPILDAALDAARHAFQAHVQTLGAKAEDKGSSNDEARKTASRKETDSREG